MLSFAPVPYSFEPPGLGQAPSALSQDLTKAGGVLASIAPATGPGAPFVSAAAGLIDLAGQVANLFHGCGQTCIQATQIVNQVEPYLLQNSETYFTNPNRTTGDQQNAIATFNAIKAIVVQNCGNPALGPAGQNCISDRFGNGMDQNSSQCWVPTDPNAYPPYGSVKYPAGRCWTWTMAYLDPIVEDIPPGGAGPATLSTAPGSSSSTAAVASSLSSYMPLLLVGGLAVILLVVLK